VDGQLVPQVGRELLLPRAREPRIVRYYHYVERLVGKALEQHARRAARSGCRDDMAHIVLFGAPKGNIQGLFRVFDSGPLEIHAPSRLENVPFI
jgi:hypothetical protein